MAKPHRLRKWHFLLLGSGLILISAFLWYWDWRSLGIPAPLQAEHFITIVTFMVGFFVLGIFVFRLTRRQVLIMLVGLILANLGMALGSVWIFRTWPRFFELLRPMSLAAYDPRYVTDWKTFFLTPPLVGFHAGLLLLWVESLVMFFVRKPTDRPE
jgi:hypothetical protein